MRLLTSPKTAFEHEDHSAEGSGGPKAEESEDPRHQPSPEAAGVYGEHAGRCGCPAAQEVGLLDRAELPQGGRHVAQRHFLLREKLDGELVAVPWRGARWVR